MDSVCQIRCLAFCVQLKYALFGYVVSVNIDAIIHRCTLVESSRPKDQARVVWIPPQPVRETDSSVMSGLLRSHFRFESCCCVSRAERNLPPRAPPPVPLRKRQRETSLLSIKMIRL